MAQDEDLGPPPADHRLHGSARALEVVGVLLAVIPCGVLAGLYLASEEITFLIACSVFAVITVVVVFWRRPARSRRIRRVESTKSAASAKDAGMGSRVGPSAGVSAWVRRPYIKRILMTGGFVFWLLVWIFTAVLFSRITANENTGMLVTYVLIGSFSPLIFYFLLENGVKRLSNQLRDDEK